MSFADGCRLDPETKKLYMHLAFMNGISYDPAMQRYIEKHTNEQPVVKIVDLLAAAQSYMHKKTGSSGLHKDKHNRRNEYNQQANKQDQQLNGHMTMDRRNVDFGGHRYHKYTISNSTQTAESAYQENTVQMFPNNSFDVRPEVVWDDDGNVGSQ